MKIGHKFEVGFGHGSTVGNYPPSHIFGLIAYPSEDFSGLPIRKTRTFAFYIGKRYFSVSFTRLFF